MNYDDNLLHIGVLAMVNPPEALGFYLMNKCDDWRIAEKRMATNLPVGLMFQDTLADIDIIVNKILNCADTQYRRIGGILSPELSEFELADYRLEIAPSRVHTNRAIYYVLYNDATTISNQITLPPHLVAMR